MSREWKKRMFSDLMSAEDNRVADEDDRLHFLKKRTTHALSFCNMTPPPYYWNVI